MLIRGRGLCLRDLVYWLPIGLDCPVNCTLLKRNADQRLYRPTVYIISDADAFETPTLLDDEVRQRGTTVPGHEDIL